MYRRQGGGQTFSDPGRILPGDANLSREGPSRHPTCTPTDQESSMDHKTLTLATLAGAALVGSLATFSLAQASDNPFAAQPPDRGDTRPAETAGRCGEGKCGEGRCGEAMALEGRCGGGDAGADEAAEGKCGEGKCGGGN
jgi:uncharacterized low-complexity protein